MRTRTRHIYTNLAIEGIEAAAVAPGEEAVAEPIPEGTDGLEAELIEVNSDIVDMGADEAVTDEATDIVDELEVAAESLRDIAANGGLDRNGARVLALYQASLNARLGLPKTARGFSPEAFGGTNTRAGQTTLAAEGFADQAKELWGKIVEMFRNALKAIVAVWNRIFDGATRMKARAEKLGVSADAMPAGSPTSPTFESPKLAEGLHINGSVDVVAASKAVLAEASIVTAITKAAVVFAAQATAIIETGDAAKLSEAAKAAHAPTASGFTKVADAASVGVAAPGEGLELFKGDALPGNKAIIATVPTEGANAAAVGKTGYKLGAFDTSKKVADNFKMKTLSKEEIKGVAKTIGDAATLVLGFKSAQKEAEAAANKVIAAAEKKANEASKDAEGKAVEGAMSGADARALAKGAMNSVVNAAPPLAAFTLNAGGYCLQAAEQSIKQYGKAKAPAAEAKPAAEPAAA